MTVGHLTMTYGHRRARGADGGEGPTNSCSERELRSARAGDGGEGPILALHFVAQKSDPLIVRGTCAAIFGGRAA